MAAGKYSFLIEQGSTFDVRLEYLDENNNPIDLSGYEARMQIRPNFGSNEIIASLSSSIDSDGTGLHLTPTVDGKVLPKSSGSIRIKISAASSSKFDFEEAKYDLEIYTMSGSVEEVSKVLKGNMSLDEEVTK